MAKARKNTTSIGLWDVGHLQATFFPTSPQRNTEQRWFQDITGGEPEEMTSKPQEIASIGPFGDDTFRLTVDLLRVAFSKFPKLDTTEEMYRPALSQKLPEAAESLIGMIDTWLSGRHPEIKRVGFSGRLFLPTKNRDGTYRKLKTLLPTVDFDVRCTDFLFRINRPRVSVAVPRLRINRLVTWAGVKTVRKRFALTGNSPSVTTEDEENDYCSLEFDINTPAENDAPIATPKLKRIIRELSTLAIEIAEKGDHK